MFAGHIKVTGGPHWTRGLDVAQVSISSTFYTCILRQYFGTKNYKAEIYLRKPRKALPYKKHVCKMLMKLTTGLFNTEAILILANSNIDFVKEFL